MFREREREREIYLCIVSVCIHTYIYIYIYISAPGAPGHAGGPGAEHRLGGYQYYYNICMVMYLYTVYTSMLDDCVFLST